MAEETIKDDEVKIIPPLQRFMKQKIVSIKKSLYNHQFLLIFLLYLVLLSVITFLPMSNSLKIMGLLIGSFILEDIHHSFKKLCQQQ